jgi:Ca2+-binding RTX toxin-like protein
MRRNKFKTRRKFERLEDRRLMAGDIDFDNGILTIDGAGLNDVAEVRIDGDQVVVDLYAGESDGTPDHSDRDEDISDVSKIVFNGFAGNDTLSVFVNSAQADLLAAEGIVLEFNGEAGDDTLDNTDPLGGIKTIANGGLNNDTLEGSRFDDKFEGGSGHDSTTGYGGNDTYKFSGANFGTDEIHEAANVDTDTLDFSEYERSVYVNLDRVYNPAADPVYTSYAVTTFNYGQIKLFNSTGLEDVVGTAYDDDLGGNSRPNHFWGGGDNDSLEGRAGNDILEGQAGSDIYHFSGSGLGTDDVIEAANSDNDGLRFSGMSSGVTVDISKAGSEFAVNSAALRLRLATDTAIERVWGSHHGDSITGNSRNNTLLGLGGNDTIRGGIGVDTLNGGADDDVLLSDALDEAVFGGTGNDRFDNFLFYETILGGTRSEPIPARFKDVGLI